jgi:hypothetical protein
MKTAPKLADSLTIRMSHASARANPPPCAWPLIAAMTGWRSRWIYPFDVTRFAVREGLFAVIRGLNAVVFKGGRRSSASTAGEGSCRG